MFDNKIIVRLKTFIIAIYFDMTIQYSNNIRIGKLKYFFLIQRILKYIIKSSKNESFFTKEII